jgi:hypothetical protein
MYVFMQSFYGACVVHMDTLFSDIFSHTQGQDIQILRFRLRIRLTIQEKCKALSRLRHRLHMKTEAFMSHVTL